MESFLGGFRELRGSCGQEINGKNGASEWLEQAVGAGAEGLVRVRERRSQWCRTMGLKDLVSFPGRFHMYMGYFVILSSSPSSSSSRTRSPSLSFSTYSSKPFVSFLYVRCPLWVSVPFTLGSGSLSLCLWVSVPLSWSVSPLRFLSLIHSGVWLAGCVSLSLCAPPPPGGSCMDLSSSLSGFLYPSYSLSLNIRFFVNFCMGSHLSWAFLILFLGIFSLSLYSSPFCDNFKEEKFLVTILTWLQFHILFHTVYMFYIVVGIILYNLIKYPGSCKIFPLLPHNICSYWLCNVPLSCTT